MIVDEQDLLEALARLELEGGDCLDLEAKTFSKYSRDALGPTLSAFANLPGGGTILLGVSENPVAVVGLQDPREQIQALVSQARQGFSTEILVDVRSIELKGRTVVVANVQEVPTNAKPCRWKENGTSYLRQYDGDYRMSLQEEQQLLIRHQRPRGDTLSVPGTSIDNLDPDLVKSFIRNARAGSTALREQPDAEVLLNLNILTEEGVATVAGLYALGRYPQRQFPALAITAAATDDEGGSRATDRLRIDGPIPRMLTAAVEWVSQNARTNIELGEDGHARNVYEYPLVAVRELIANALVHRDLSEPALSKGVEIRLTRDRLIISSPGGLWGLTVDQLGTRDGKSAVNERLYDICTFTTDADGRRVIEGLGTGIRAVREALRQADMEPVRFQDTGVRFTALLPRAALPSTKEGREWIPEQVAAVSANAAAVWSCLATPKTRVQITEATGLTGRQVKWALDRLKAAGFIVFQGRQGSTATTYRRA